MYKRRIMLSMALSVALISASSSASDHGVGAIFAEPEKSVDTGVKIRTVLNGAINSDTITASKQTNTAAYSVDIVNTLIPAINPLMLALASKQVQLSISNDAVMINGNFERIQ